MTAKVNFLNHKYVDNDDEQKIQKCYFVAESINYLELDINCNMDCIFGW